MGWLSIILADATENLVENPSCELNVTGYDPWKGATVARSGAQSKWGGWSCAVTPSAITHASGTKYPVTVSTYTTYTFSGWMLGQLGTYYTAGVWNSIGYVIGHTEIVGTGAWQFFKVTFTTIADVNLRLFITQDNPGRNVFYVDGWQLEAKAYATTYCDGDQPDCEWAGAEHASPSTRSALTRRGGRIVDIADDYDICTGQISGLGMPPLRHNVRNMALQPGALMDNVKVLPRVMTLSQVIQEVGGRTALHAVRKNIINAIKNDAVAALMPYTFQYNAFTVPTDLRAQAIRCEAYYDSGLGGRWEDKGREKYGLRMIAYDPLWYEVGESAQALDTNDNEIFRIIAGRLRSTGQWDALGPPTTATATYLNIYALAEDDTYLYVGGEFLNFNDIANADHVVRYNKQTGAWSSLGTGMNNVVRALVVGPDGTLYAGGLFTSAGGVVTQRIAQWNGVVWSPVGAGFNGSVYAFAIGLDGTLYAGGAFTDLSGGG